MSCRTVISPELVMEVEARMKRNYLPPSMQPKQQPQMINTCQIPMQQLQNNFQQLQFANQTPMLQYQQNNTPSNNSLLSFQNTNAMSVNNTMLNANNGYNKIALNVSATNPLPPVSAANVQNQPQRKYSSHGPHRCKLQTLATVQELGKSTHFFFSSFYTRAVESVPTLQF